MQVDLDCAKQGAGRRAEIENIGGGSVDGYRRSNISACGQVINP